RDRLLEYNSCRPTEAQRLTAWANEQDNSSTLFDYMELIFDCYGVDTEEHSHHSFILRPSEHLQVAFPGLPEDGLIITFDRATALANEDMHFITWEHPMVIDSMDMVVSSELGNTALSALKYRKTKPGTLLLEAVYVLEAISGGELQSNRYLPPTPVRVVVDQEGHDHSGDLSHAQLMTALITVDNETAAKVVRSQAQKLRTLVTLSEQLAARHAPQLLAEAQAKSQKSLTEEVNRLIALRALNPNVRDEEIAYFTTQLAALSHAIASAKLRLDALRVIVAM
ncbi:MAG: ATP-dependent helicase HepA, partial [Halothiobacillaceae bacterium]